MGAYEALNNGTIDVLANALIEFEYDFGSEDLEGVHFSTPYYFGNESFTEDLSAYSLATREDDAIFSSFVECVVGSTMHAQRRKISKKTHREIGLLSMFGSDTRVALQDAISFSGNYDEIIQKNFPHVDLNGDGRGRNKLNDRGPMVHSYPGLNRYRKDQHQRCRNRFGLFV